ncbi:MAG: hypothetical protein H6Q52_2971 [Deltaproteobacteria bacterium]|nr:hypothetical protein [Deltaproteobacteria bacterium]
MGTSIHRVVYKEKHGGWINKVEYADKPSSVHYTQLAAIASAKMMLREQGGGTLIVRDLNGLIKDRIQIYPGKLITVVRTKGGYR